MPSHLFDFLDKQIWETILKVVPIDRLQGELHMKTSRINFINVEKEFAEMKTWLDFG